MKQYVKLFLTISEASYTSEAKMSLHGEKKTTKKPSEAMQVAISDIRRGKLSKKKAAVYYDVPKQHYCGI